MEQGPAFLEALMREFISEGEVQWQDDIAACEQRIEDRLQRQRESQDSEFNAAREAIVTLERQNKSLTEDVSKALRKIGELTEELNKGANARPPVDHANIGGESERATESSQSPEITNFFTPEDEPIPIPSSHTFGRTGPYEVAAPVQSPASPFGAKHVDVLPRRHARNAATKRKRPLLQADLGTHSSRGVYKGPRLRNDAHLFANYEVGAGKRVPVPMPFNSKSPAENNNGSEARQLPMKPMKTRNPEGSRIATPTEAIVTHSTDEDHHDNAETLKIAEMAVAASKANRATTLLPSIAEGHHSPRVVIDKTVDNGHTFHSDNIVVGHRKPVVSSDRSMAQNGMRDSLGTTTAMHDDESDQETADLHALLMEQFRVRKGDKQSRTQASEKRPEIVVDTIDETNVRPVRQRVRNKRYAGDYVLDVKEFDRRLKH